MAVVDAVSTGEYTAEDEAADMSWKRGLREQRLEREARERASIVVRLLGRRVHLPFVRARSVAFIWWRELRYGGWQWANRRMFGHRFGRWA